MKDVGERKMANLFYWVVMFIIMAIGWGFFSLFRVFPEVSLLIFIVLPTLLATVWKFKSIRKAPAVILLILVVVSSSVFGFLNGLATQQTKWTAEKQDQIENRMKYKIEKAQTVDIKQKLESGQSWLHIYCAGIPDCDPEKELLLVQCLVDRGADINAKDNNGETPLFWAVRFGKKHIVEFLIACGAKVNIREQDGVTPLDQALRLGNRSMTELLRQHGAKTSAELDQ